MSAKDKAAEAEAEAPKRRMLVLKSSDGQELEVESSLAVGSEMIKHLIDDGFADGVVPLPNVTGAMLTKVVEYWRRHAQGDEGSREMRKWDRDFVDMDDEERFELILAANFLAAKPLLDVLCQAVADTIKDMKVEEVRDYFNIENDFTEEEERAIREEHAWAFD